MKDSSISLDKEINQYLPQLNEAQKKAVLGVVKTFASEEDHVYDDTYVTEMDKRFKELETGKVKGFTLDEMEASARLSYKTKSRGK